MVVDKLSNLVEISTGELQFIFRKMIDEIELRSIYAACERVAKMLFTNCLEQRQWFEGCISPEALKYFRQNNIPNFWGKWYLVERIDEEYPWDVVYQNPITGDKGVKFKDGNLAKSFVTAINNNNIQLELCTDDCPFKTFKDA